jgi:hypothetical protein
MGSSPHPHQNINYDTKEKYSDKLSKKIMDWQWTNLHTYQQHSSTVILIQYLMEDFPKHTLK